jgi:hypothetical protein
VERVTSIRDEIERTRQGSTQTARSHLAKPSGELLQGIGDAPQVRTLGADYQGVLLLPPPAPPQHAKRKGSATFRRPTPLAAPSGRFLSYAVALIGVARLACRKPRKASRPRSNPAITIA